MPGEGGSLLVGDGCLVLVLQLPLSLSVVPEVALCADQEDWNAGTVVGHLKATQEGETSSRHVVNPSPAF